MHFEPSLDESIVILEECFASASDVEASKRIIRLLLLENEATKRGLRPVLSKQLFKPNSSRVQKSILLLLRSFGVDSVDFPALQKCIGSNDNIEYLAWNIMAKNAQKEIDKGYISKTREIWREGLNDGDPQIRLAAITLLEIANEEQDLVAISRMILDQNEQVRRRAITGLSANKQSTQICRDKISEFFKLCTECSDLSMRHFELGMMISMCDKNGASFVDSAPILLLLQKIKTGSHDLMYETMLMIAYQLVGLCGESAVDIFPDLKISFLKTQDFRALRACLFMAARVPSLTQETLTLVDYAVTNAKSESNANQALNDLYILGDAARPYIPRLLEIFKDTSLGFTRYAAADALAKLLDKNENGQEIECLLSHLNDSNLVVVQGACRALGTIFQDDS
ncbi:MAG: hypothetical protein K2X81_19540, partial [Candidatus Obscuribacterales bacterium]|nr:hypothetical protein [Candidatus Obscuribacterales bacterium]